MTLATYSLGATVACVLAVAATPAQASPVSIDYSVSNIEVCYFNDTSNASPLQPTCSSVPGAFLLTLSYDDSVSTAFQDVNPDNNLQTRFIDTVAVLSLAGFTPVPNPFGGTETTGGQIVGRTREIPTLHQEYVDLLSSRAAQIITSSPIDVTERFWTQVFGLFSVADTAGPQDLLVNAVTTADIEARLRGALGPLDFRYDNVAFTRTCDSGACGVFNIDYVPGSFSLTGVATPVAAAVPEPSSLLLLGSGLAGVLYRRRVRRQ